MVAIVTGNGLGLDRSSAKVLGSRGQLGQAALGRANDNVYVNAATGNLVIQNTDEVLIGRGPDDVIARTYNSLGTFNDDNGDNWRPSVQRVVTGLTGTVNTAGSTITRYDWDGSDVVYTWDATRSAYVAKEGEGAYDTLTFAGTTWTWTDGANRLTETYDSANGGRITKSTDADNNSLTFSYGANGLVSYVVTADGYNTAFNYSTTRPDQLIGITTAYLDILNGNTVTHTTRTTYGYDASNRLSTVTVDLTPNDTTDSSTYVTTYTYVGASKRVQTIAQSDGSFLRVVYDASNRVSQLIQTAAAGVTRTTLFDYSTPGSTVVTDPAGQTTTLSYDAKGQLTSVTMPPAVSGASAQVMNFTYDANGNVLTANPGPSNTVTYTYDANGNVLLERDSVGNTITRTYGSKNELLTETRYTVPDPDQAGAGQPSGALTTRYAYDAENHLRYVITPEGRVTEYRYNSYGQCTSTLEYAANSYDTSGLTSSQAPTEAAMNTWAAAADVTQVNRTDVTYNLRGQEYTVRKYAKTLSDGTGDTSVRAEYLYEFYWYDQAGNLQKHTSSGAATAETYLYDGLNRLTNSVDFEGMSTSIQFNDASSTTVVTIGAGTKTSVYNLAGELISYAQSGADVTTATTTYSYDSLGRMRMETDPTGLKTYHLYDNVGRKVADVEPDGTVTEYTYNANNLLIETQRHNTPLTPAADDAEHRQGQCRLPEPAAAGHGHDLRPLRVAHLR